MINITNKANCSGCTACYNICPKSAITMVEDSEGFLYPKVDTEKCVDCGFCDKVCPLLHYGKSQKNTVLRAYVAHHRNKNIWYESSSGGAFTAITDYVYANDGVVFGAVYDSDFQIRHDKAETPKEALKFRGSKYAQSRLNDVFKEIKKGLASGRKILFSATPCQVAGLYSYLRKDYDNLFTVDLICHCVPSPKVFKDYIKYIETKYKKKIVRINMKDKTQGWPIQTPRLYFDDGSSLFAVKDSYLWETIFYSYLAIRPSCHSCRFSNLNRVGDITIGDYWGVEKYHPEYNLPQGASLVLINTPKGEKAFEEISSKLESTVTDVVKALPNTLLYSTKPHPKRSEFWKDYHQMPFEKVCKKYLEPTVIGRLKRFVFRALSIFKRKITKQ